MKVKQNQSVFNEAVAQQSAFSAKLPKANGQHTVVKTDAGLLKAGWSEEGQVPSSLFCLSRHNNLLRNKQKSAVNKKPADLEADSEVGVAAEFESLTQVVADEVGVNLSAPLLDDGVVVLAQSEAGAVVGGGEVTTSGALLDGGVVAGSEAVASVGAAAVVHPGWLAGFAAVSVTAIAASSSTTATDHTPPNFQSLTVKTSQQIVLTYDSELDKNSLPKLDAFSVKVDGVLQTVQGVSIDGNTVVLTLQAPLTAGKLTVSYTDPNASLDDATAVIQDAAGNDAASLLPTDLDVTSGVVADGYIRGAQIYIDANGDGVAQDSEKQIGVTTGDDGTFFLPDNVPEGTVIVRGGVNMDTGIDNTLELKAPARSKVVNPLTTLVQALIDQDKSAVSDTDKANNAAKRVADAFGLIGKDLRTYDPLHEKDVDAQKIAAGLATILTLVDSAGREDALNAIGQKVVENPSAVMTLTEVTDFVVQKINFDKTEIQTAVNRIGSAKSIQDISNAQYVTLQDVNELPTFNAVGQTRVLIESDNGWNYPDSMTLLSDGKILVTGAKNNNELIVLRLNSDGTLDKGFDVDGRVDIPVKSSGENYYDLQPLQTLEQSDGRLIVVAQNSDGCHVIRLNVDGSVDYDKKLDAPIGTEYTNIALQSDDKIVLVGQTVVDGHQDSDFFAIRLNSNGTFDTTFDGDGKAIIPVTAHDDDVEKVVLQSDGKMLILGTSNGVEKEFSSTPSLIRLNANGSLDTDFAENGKKFFSGLNANAITVRLTDDDGIIVVADSVISTQSKVAQKMLALNVVGSVGVNSNVDGFLDTAFAGSEKEPVATLNPDPIAIELASDEEMVFVADPLVFAQNDIEQKTYLLALSPDGSVDTNSNLDGSLGTVFTESEKELTVDLNLDPIAVGLSNDDEIIVETDPLMSAQSNVEQKTYLFGLNADGSVNKKFGDNGVVVSNEINRMGSFDVQHDGKIVSAAYFVDPTSQSEYLTGYYGIIRCLPDGSLDSSFGDNGKMVVSHLPLDGDSFAGGKSVNNGEYYIGVGQTGDFWNIFRLNANGDLDPTFNPNSGTSVVKNLAYSPGMMLAETANIYDPEFALLDNYGGSILTVSRQGENSTDDQFGFDTTYYSSTNEIAIESNKLLYGPKSTEVADLVNQNGQLEISFNQNATQAVVDTVLKNIYYTNSTAPNPGQLFGSDIQIELEFTDGVDRPVISEIIAIDGTTPIVTDSVQSCPVNTEITVIDGTMPMVTGDVQTCPVNTGIVATDGTLPMVTGDLQVCPVNTGIIATETASTGSGVDAISTTTRFTIDGRGSDSTPDTVNVADGSFIFNDSSIENSVEVVGFGADDTFLIDLWTSRNFSLEKSGSDLVFKIIGDSDAQSKTVLKDVNPQNGINDSVLKTLPEIEAFLTQFNAVENMGDIILCQSVLG